jgi:hypothetical protein
MLNLQRESRTSCEQQDQKESNQHDAGITNSQVPTEISRISVWLLPFWDERPAVWLAQTGAQFTLAGISSEQTKFCYVILQLDQHYTAEVEDIITSPPERDPYTTVKTKLVIRLSASREQCIRQFLTLSTKLTHLFSNKRNPRPSFRNHCSGSRSPSQDNATPTPCWYHHYYRARAQKCMQPCSYRQQEKLSQRTSTMAYISVSQGARTVSTVNR